MKFRLIILLSFSYYISSFGQSIEKTQLGASVIKQSDESYVKLESVDYKQSLKTLNEVENIKFQKLKDYIIEQDIKLHLKKMDLSDQRTTNKYKLEQSLKIKNNALSNTFKEIDQRYIKEEMQVLEEYKKLESKSQEIENIAKISDSQKASKTVNKLFGKLIGNTSVITNDKPKLVIRSIDNKIKEDSLVLMKDSKLIETKTTYKPTPVKLDDRKSWEIKNADSSNVLLTYTPEKFQNYYGETPFLTIESSIVKTGKDYLLNLKFIFSSKDVSKGYGYINKNDILKIDFLKSQSIKLYAIDNFSPMLESFTGYTIYLTQYRFENKSDYKKLLNKHLDKIGVSWSLGYEEYPIYNLDFYFQKPLAKP